MNAKGVIIRLCKQSVKEVIDELQELLQQRGITIYARIDQQSEVNNAGQNLPPLEFILFGNPKVGGPLMVQNPLIALDLPIKAIAFEDDEQRVWIAYNDAGYIEHRYSLDHDPNSPFDLNGLMKKLFENSQ